MFSLFSEKIRWYPNALNRGWPEAVRVLARGRARGIFPGPVNVALLALELVSPSRSLPVDSLSRSSEDGSRAPMLKRTGVGMKPMT